MFQRLHCNLNVWYKVEDSPDFQHQFCDSEIEAVAVNISAGGIGLISDYSIPKFAILSITFILLRKTNVPGEVAREKPVRLKGEVRYSLTAEDNKFHIGIRFMEVPDECKQDIEEWGKAGAALL
jgi:hypothetical protein